ncbi:MAG: cell wall hydrolase [Vallitaleaceae bacterium]|nr:cell wall hydrolase [Vallitaleaceae bacterium]
MFKLKHLFESMWFGHKSISKKVYTTGLMIFSGVFVIAVVMLSVNGFAKTKTIDHIVLYETEDEDQSENRIEETTTVAEASEESSYDTFARSNDNDTLQLENEEAVTLAKEDEQDRVFKTATENLEESQINLLNLKDYTALVRIVEAEATNEDLKGKILVANTVMNRVKSRRFPNTIYEVVHQRTGNRAQFSPIDDGRYYKVTIKDSTIKAVEQALNGVDYSNGAMFFVSKSLASENASSWFDDNLTFLFQHGGHHFYKY